jgi:hypothetical protein
MHEERRKRSFCTPVAYAALMTLSVVVEGNTAEFGRRKYDRQFVQRYDNLKFLLRPEREAAA